MPTMTEDQHFTEIVSEALTSIGDQAYVSQSRCVDVFLDLFQATSDPFIRWSIADQLTEIRFVRMVRGDSMRAALAAIVDISAAVELTEADWCDRLVEACDHRMPGFVS
jgi:hypothetical protein